MSKPKVLFFDIETSPIITKEYKWGIWDERPIVQEIIQDWQVLTIAWKWAGKREKKFVLGQDDFPDYVPGQLNDLSLLKAFWPILASADVGVAHHGDPFDYKKLRARMVIQKLPPLPDNKQYDTKKAYKRVGAFTSKKLAHLSRDTGGSAKGDPGGFKTWQGCMAGDPRSWKHMKKYNLLDLPPLEDIYDVITPWDKQAPAMNVLADKPEGCVRCLGTKFESRGLTPPTKSGTRRHRYYCLAEGCHKWNIGRTIVRTEPQLTS